MVIGVNIMWDYKRAAASAKIFDAVTPVLEHYFGGEILSTENHDSQIDILLDCKCGIDAIVDTNKSVFGIAHRVSYNYYKTFTIRTYDCSGRPTEIDHMRQSGIKSRYHVQTICVDNKPVVIAIAKSMDLLYAIDDGLAKIKTAFSGDKFAVLDWNTLRENDIPVDIIKL